MNKKIEFLKNLSFKEGNFKLSSGKISNFYFDIKKALLNGKGNFYIVTSIYQILNIRVIGIGGMELGAVPLVSSISFWSYQMDNPLNSFIIRKKPKEYGTSQYIEGLENFSENSKVAILEDVTTTGKSILTAYERTLECGLIPIQLITVLDREEGSVEYLDRNGISLYSLYKKSDFINLE